MSRSILSKLIYTWLHLVESLIRNISGPVGRKLRFFYYKRRLKSCGHNVIIDVGVIIEGAEYIEMGDNVWVNHYSQLIAGRPSADHRIMKFKSNSKFKGESGSLYIGSGVGVGPYNVLHGYGGLVIGNNVTTSAGVKIYSFSHYYRNDEDPTMITYANCMADSPNISCISSPIVIEEGCWLGIDALVFAGTIGKNSFVQSRSVVVGDLPENSYAGGQPAVKLRNRFEGYSG